MFGFSIPKLLVLFVIILVVWYFFKFIEKQNKLSKNKKDNVKKNPDNDESKFKKNEVEDLIKCPECGNYYASHSACTVCRSK